MTTNLGVDGCAILPPDASYLSKYWGNQVNTINLNGILFIYLFLVKNVGEEYAFPNHWFGNLLENGLVESLFNFTW